AVEDVARATVLQEEVPGAGGARREGRGDVIGDAGYDGRTCRQTRLDCRRPADLADDRVRGPHARHAGVVDTPEDEELIRPGVGRDGQEPRFERPVVLGEELPSEAVGDVVVRATEDLGALADAGFVLGEPPELRRQYLLVDGPPRTLEEAV